MIRKVGKYTVKVTEEEITIDNYFKYSVTIIEPDFFYIDKSDLCLWFAQVFRYSNNEQEISDVLNGYIRVLEYRTVQLERIVD